MTASRVRRTPFVSLAGGALPAAAAALFVVLAAGPAAAQPLLEGRVGVAASLHGDIVDDLDLDVGLGIGGTASYYLSPSFALDARIDYIVLNSEKTVRTGFAGDFEPVNLDITSRTVALTAGFTVAKQWDGFELYFGAHPGLYISKLDASTTGNIIIRGPVIDVSVNAAFSEESNTSVDFGVNGEVGARVTVWKGLFVGGEVAYHFALLRDEIDDEVGTLLVSGNTGWRF